MISGKFEWDNSAKLVDEGLSIQDQKKIVGNSQWAAILSIIASSALIYFSILIQNTYPNIDSIFFNAILFTGISGIVISILMIIWSRNHKLTTQGDDLLDNQNPFDTLLFILSSLQILVSLMLILYIFIENKIIKDTYLVEHGKDKFDDFSYNYKLLESFGVLAIVVQQISFVYFTYSIYITSITQFDAKGLVHCFNMIFALFSLATLWGIAYCQNYYDSISTLKNYISDFNLHFLYVLGIIGLVLSLFAYIVNTRQSRINYIILGALLLIFITLSSCINKEVLQSARSIEYNYIVNCNSDHLIQKVSQNYLSQQKCQKYRTTELKSLDGKVIKKDGKPVITYDLSCPQDFMALVWEEKSQSNQQACLNMQCCSITANSFAIWWYRTGFLAFGMILSGFLTSMSSFFLTQRENQRFTINLFGVHFTALILLLALLGAGFYLIQFNYKYELPQVENVQQSQKQVYNQNSVLKRIESQLFIENLDISKNNSDNLQNLQNNDGLEFIEEKDQTKNTYESFQPEFFINCKPLVSFVDYKINLNNDCQNKQSSCDKQLKLTVTSEAGYFKFSNLLLNDSRYRFFNILYTNNVLLKVTPQTAYVELQADASDINDFLINELQYCGANPLNAPLFTIESREVESFRKQAKKQQKADNSSNKIQSSNLNNRRNLLHKSILHQSLSQQDEIIQCKDKLYKQFDQYTQSCFKGNSGDYQNQVGNFTTVWGYESLSPKTTFTISGYIMYKSLDQQCGQQQNQPEKLLEQHLQSQKFNNYLSDAEVQIYFEVKGEQKLYVSAKSDKNGRFQINLPVFYNEISYFGHIQISHPGIEGQQFLQFNQQLLLGQPQDISLKDVYLLTQTGLPIEKQNKQCGSKKISQPKQQKSQQNSKKHKIEYNDNIQESEFVNQQLKSDENNGILNKCQNRLKDIQNAQKLCKYKLVNQMIVKQQQEYVELSEISDQYAEDQQFSPEEFSEDYNNYYEEDYEDDEFLDENNNNHEAKKAQTSSKTKKSTANKKTSKSTTSANKKTVSTNKKTSTTSTNKKTNSSQANKKPTTPASKNSKAKTTAPNKQQTKKPIAKNTKKSSTAPKKQQQQQKAKTEKVDINVVNRIQFYTLELKIYDIFTKHSLNQDLKVYLYKNYHSCYTKPQSQYLFREIHIQKHETDKYQAFFNIIEDSYTIVVQTEGYHSYCDNIQAILVQQQVHIPLVKKQHALQVVLEHGNHQLQSSLSLQTQDKNGQKRCFVSSYNQECEDINLYNIENQNALGQLITIKSLKDQQYLFFVQKIPYTDKEKLIVENLQQGIEVPLKDLKKNVQNQEFSNGNIRIKLYVKERDFQVQESHIPYISTERVEYDPVLTWLSMCINGKQGDTSSQSLNKFWIRNNNGQQNDNNIANNKQLKQKLQLQEQNWWIQNEPAGILNPNSQLCSLYYAQTQSNNVE